MEFQVSSARERENVVSGVSVPIYVRLASALARLTDFTPIRHLRVRPS
jgi:hypothetical protein